MAICFYNVSMSIIYNDTEEKSELQRRIVADMRAKQLSHDVTKDEAGRAAFDDTSDPDYASECQFNRPAIMIVGVVAGLLILIVLAYLLFFN